MGGWGSGWMGKWVGEWVAEGGKGQGSWHVLRSLLCFLFLLVL